MLSITAGATTGELVEACGEDPGAVCEWVFERTDNETLAKAVSWLTGAPLRILIIVVVAAVANYLLRRAIRHLADRIRSAAEDVSERSPTLTRELIDERTDQRTETITGVLRSITTVIVWAIALLLVLAELGVNLAPLIAGAGIVGVALGFGAQSLVKDFLSGIFMIVEDQYGVGDIVDVGEASGSVEKVTLRTTTLRDVNGTLWHVPNGEILRVGNKSQRWARALLDVDVAYGTDLRRAQEIIKRVADEVGSDPEWEGHIEEEPEVWGIQDLAADSVVIRLVVKTEPASQFQLERELRLRIKEAFDQEGIEIPFPQRTLWLRADTEPGPG